MRAAVSPLLLPIALCGGMAAACVVSVEADFDHCVDGDQVRYVDETYQKGCRTCTCVGAGEEACGACTCTGPAGETALSGETIDAPDGCNRCSCGEDGKFSCTTIACPECDPALAIACDPAPPGCVAEPICTELGWGCALSCDRCAPETFGGCGDPGPGCWWEGPTCVDGQWSCGQPICDGCLGEPILCADPEIMGCYAYPFCDGNQWTCLTACEEGPYCPDPAPTCEDPMLPRGCFSYALCTPMGWVCQPDCPSCGETDAPGCETTKPGCLGTAYCEGVDWSCTFVCE